MDLFNLVMLACLSAMMIAAFCEKLDLETRYKLNLAAVFVAVAALIISN